MFNPGDKVRRFVNPICNIKIGDTDEVVDVYENGTRLHLKKRGIGFHSKYFELVEPAVINTYKIY